MTQPTSFRVPYNRLTSIHSGLMLPARITLPHFSVSWLRSLPKSAGEPGRTVPPNSASRALILGSARPALTSRFSFSMMCFRELGIFLQLIDQAIVCFRLLDSQPGKKWDEEKHSDDGNVVRRRRDYPKLVPV